MIDFDNKGDLSDILAADRSECSKGCRDSTASSLDSEFEDIVRIEVFRIRGE